MFRLVNVQSHLHHCWFDSVADTSQSDKFCSDGQILRVVGVLRYSSADAAGRLAVRRQRAGH